MNLRHTHRPVWAKQFLTWGSLFPRCLWSMSTWQKFNQNSLILVVFWCLKGLAGTHTHTQRWEEWLVGGHIRNTFINWAGIWYRQSVMSKHYNRYSNDEKTWYHWRMAKRHHKVTGIIDVLRWFNSYQWRSYLCLSFVLFISKWKILYLYHFGVVSMYYSE